LVAVVVYDEDTHTPHLGQSCPCRHTQGVWVDFCEASAALVLASFFAKHVPLG